MTPHVNDVETYLHREKVMNSYFDWLKRRIDEGWHPYLLTFMFNQLPDSPSARRAAMIREIGVTYKTFVTRCMRHPSRTPSTRLPLWFCCPDFPVWKWEKSALCDAVINDGEHYHVFMLEPPWSRLPEPLELHLAYWEGLYVGRGRAIQRIHVLPIIDTPDKVFGYVTKAIRQNRASLDDVLLFPQALSEVNEGDPMIGRGGDQARRATLAELTKVARRSRTFRGIAARRTQDCAAVGMPR